MDSIKRKSFNANVDLIHGPIFKSLIIFALPLFISNIFQQLYNTVDTMIVGNFLGDASLAAIGSCTSIYDLLVGFALGIGNGLAIVTARSFGSKDEKLLKKSVASSLVIGIVVSIGLTLIGLIFLQPLLHLLNTPANIIDEAYSYIFFIVLFIIVMFAYNLCAGLMRAIGNSVMPLVFLVVSSVLNIILDLVFITQLNMGVHGAAVATVISQGTSVILCIIYMFKKTPLLLPKKEHFEVDKDLYKELLGQGFSMGFMMSIVSAGTVILQSAINDFGYLIIAGHGTARKLNSFCMMPAGTIGLALSTFVSQNKGANQQQRIRDGVRYGNLIACAWGALITVILFFGAPLLVQLISGSREPTVIDNATLYLRINAPFYAVLGILLNLRNSLQGLGMKIIPLVSSVIECLGKIVFVALFIPVLHYFGVIICEPVIWCCMCLQLAWSFYHNPYIKGAKNNQETV